MLDALMETAFRLGVNEHVHPMLLAWDDDWTTAGVPVCDVALASRSIATGDMQAALAKLDEHARRRVCITLTTGLSPRVDPVLLDAIGREQPRYPDCVFAFNILWGMGVHPELSYIDSSRQSRFESFDEAIDKTCDAMGVTAEERERLIAYSRQHLTRFHGRRRWDMLGVRPHARHAMGVFSRGDQVVTRQSRRGTLVWFRRSGVWRINPACQSAVLWHNDRTVLSPSSSG